MSPRSAVASRAAAALLASFLALAAAGCGKKGSTAPTLATATVTGVAVDAISGSTLMNVSVKSSAGASTTTDANGRFSISVPANQLVRLDVTRSDYSLNQVVMQLATNETRAISVSLLTAGTTSAVAPATGGKVTDANSGATLSLPANFVTASGSVSVRVTGLDPTSDEVKALPGGLDAVDANGQAVYLKPVSFAEYTVTDSKGNVLQFNPSASQGATIELPIPASLRGQPGYQNGDPIECYVYDPTDGKWKTPVPGVIGASSVDGTTPAIKATIFHLSWYGGAPATTAIGCIEGTVTLNGTPVPNCDIDAYPGGDTRTDASGHYQVQAAANSTVRVSASILSGTSFHTAEASVTVGAAGGACAQLDLALGGATTGQYSVEGSISEVQLVEPGPTFYDIQSATVSLEVSGGATQVPVTGAKVQVGSGNTFYTLTEGNGGEYSLNNLSQSLALTPGATYTLRVDFDNDGTWDATGSVPMAGAPVVTSPADSATVGKSFTVAWSDSGVGMPGYAPIYFGILSGSSTGSEFATTSRSFAVGTGVTDSVSHLPNPPLTAGAYDLLLSAAEGSIYTELLGQAPTPNMTGTNVTGYFYSLSVGPEWALTSTGSTARALASRAAPARWQAPPPTAVARALAEVRRLQAQARARLQRAGNLQARR